MSEHPSHHSPEQKTHEPNMYYISETGSVWSPMVEVGTLRNLDGEVTKYILGDPYDMDKTKEVPAAWFDAHKDQLQIKEGEAWTASNDKPTLQTEVIAVPEAAASQEVSEQAEVPREVREEIGGEVLATAGVDAPVEQGEVSREKELMDQINQLREGLSDRDRMALHQYATALYGHEETAARRKMSLELQGDTQRLLKTRDLYQKLSQARKSN